ncbi:MAG: MoxR family ATPase [Chitinophagaceae bacterium]|nr:MoxR family ATPase [Chitinophagaceae bacterium]
MDSLSFENRIDIQAISAATDKIKDEIGKVLVGQHEALELMLVAMLSGGHILIEGVPGVAKTLTAKLLSRTISVAFSRIQFTPDLMPSDVIGTNVYNPQKANFEFRKGPIFSNIVLIDEINRAPAKTQSALFEVMEEKTITVDGTRYNMETPFMVLATQNPVEHEGTYSLPEAQLDRFAFKILVHYPKESQEVDILLRHHQNHSMHDSVEQVQPVISNKELEALRALVSNVSVDEKLLKYIAQITCSTRSKNGILLGASPRASVSILHSAKALATLRGRDFVTPEDITFVALPALRHRLALSAEKEMDGTTTDDMIKEILKGIEIPR